MNRTINLLLSLILSVQALAGNNRELINEFRNPPKANRPEVWWWFDQNAPDEAITRDLEALSRAGITAFTVYSQNGYATDQLWRQKVKWALHEAGRLGIDGFICIGCAGCGHPDTSVESARKDIAASRAAATGGGRILATLPKAPSTFAATLQDGTPKHYGDIACLAIPRRDGSCAMPGEVLDISRYLDPDTDVLDWPDAPAGEWDICRVGWSVNGIIENGYNGCFIDHLSKEAFDEHWSHAVQPLLDVLDGSERAALKGVMCDSWEHGPSGWTLKFAEEFLTRRGYDIKPWLPAIAGIEIGSAERTARFKRDYTETVSELLAENHYAYQKEVANRHGLLSVAEAAGPHQWQGDVRRMQGKCDISMGEFWMPSGHRPEDPQRFMLRDAAAAAHVYGIGEVLAESFTTINTYWIECPASMKPVADRAFCDGLTRVCYHGMMLSPSMTDKPGKIRNAGTHFNPQTTWFEQSRAFNTYLGRCSRMLSEGRFHADCLVYAGDATKLFSALKTTKEVLGDGYDYDYCPTEVLMQARVEKGEVVIPSGMRYKVIKLSERNPETVMNMKPGKREMLECEPYHYPMTEEAVTKLLSLVNDGAVLLGDRPEGPISINDSPERFNEAADALWNFEGMFHKVGKGYVFRDRDTLLDWLREKNYGPDFSYSGTDASIDWIHRTCDGREIYFISNQSPARVSFTARFRIKARKAGIWDPVTGDIRSARRTGGSRRCSEFALELPPYGSAFVVFGHAGKNRPRKDAKSAGTVSPASWTLAFDPVWGGPEDALTLDALKDWTDFEDTGIKYYSGTATYRTTFEVPDGCSSVDINLGTVRNMAEVFVNGRPCGIAWTEPYEVSSDCLETGENVLEIQVTNLWPNRLILDSGLPESERLTHTNINPYKPEDKPLPSGLLGPVKLSFHK